MDSQLYSPDGSSVLVDGVVGGATGISTPKENMTYTQKKISFIITCIDVCVSVFVCMHVVMCVNVYIR